MVRWSEAHPYPRMVGSKRLPEDDDDRTFAMCQHHQAFPYHQRRRDDHAKIEDLVVQLQETDYQTRKCFTMRTKTVANLKNAMKRHLAFVHTPHFIEIAKYLHAEY